MHKVRFAVSVCLLVLAACGGDSGSQQFGPGSTTSSSTGGAGGTGGTGGTTTTYSMGNGSGSSFQSGAIAIANASLPAGGTTSLQISIVDQTGTLYTSTATTITLNSPCVAQGLATITAAAPTQPGSTPGTLSTTTGTADATYTAKGCSGGDVITATATVGSQNLSASGTVTVAPAAVGSIQFISATPASIGLKGTGLAETSTVVFKVVDSTGGPRPGASVTFSLNTTVGGVSLSPASATSAADGTVQTVVSSGTVHTSVRVTASITSPALSTQSSVLTVTTGLPASNAFSIAVGPATYAGSSGTPPACPNVEAYGIDGVTVPVTVRLADRYNNPAPDGTAVAFNTNGGHIGGSCTTPSAAGAADGTCTVTWTSANPRPSPSSVPPALANGRATILATATGEESFTDVNGDGFWESGEPFVDLGEPYRDDNENGKYDLGEYFLDFNQNGTWDAPDGTFKGITCTGSPPTTCSTKTLAIGAAHIIIMSTSGANITLLSPASLPLTIAQKASGSIQFNLKDMNGGPIAAGSTISVTADSAVGTISSVNGSVIMGCSTTVGGNNFTTNFTAAGTAGSGNIYVTVTSPGSKTVSGPLVIPVTVQ